VPSSAKVNRWAADAGCRRQRVAHHRVGIHPAGLQGRSRWFSAEAEGQRLVGAGVEQRRDVAGGSGGLALHVAGAAGNAAGQPVSSTVPVLLTGSPSGVVVDVMTRALAAAEPPVFVEVGGARRIELRLIVRSFVVRQRLTSWSTRVKSAPLLPSSAKVNTWGRPTPLSPSACCPTE